MQLHKKKNSPDATIAVKISIRTVPLFFILNGPSVTAVTSKCIFMHSIRWFLGWIGAGLFLLIGFLFPQSPHCNEQQVSKHNNRNRFNNQ